MKKYFVLDTRILLTDADNIFGFDDNYVILTGTTLQELDRYCSEETGIGSSLKYNAIKCCHYLDELRERGDLLNGVPINDGGTIFIEPNGVRKDYLPSGYSLESPDNRIISTCVFLNKYSHRFMNDRIQVILVTNNTSMRVNAAICGIKVENYRNDIVEDSGYTGYTQIDIPDEMLTDFHKNGWLPDITDKHLYENEFVALMGGGHPAGYAIVKNGALKNITMDPTPLFGWIKAMNDRQRYALYALTRPASEIPLVILKGPAGTAKTFLSLAVGLNDILSHKRKKDRTYNKILISRPSSHAFSGIGFLQGGIEGKLSPLLAGYFDNMEIILGGADDELEPEQVQVRIDDMMESKTIEIIALDFIRGRSLINSIVICDEAQNATGTLIRDVITRAGRNTKVVICGDTSQIDAMHLDRRNNGLAFAIETMKGSPNTAIIEFLEEDSVRSPLAAEAIKRMK